MWGLLQKVRGQEPPSTPCLLLLPCPSGDNLHIQGFVSRLPVLVVASRIEEKKINTVLEPWRPHSKPQLSGSAPRFLHDSLYFGACVFKGEKERKQLAEGALQVTRLSALILVPLWPALMSQKGKAAPTRSLSKTRHPGQAKKKKEEKKEEGLLERKWKKTHVVFPSGFQLWALGEIHFEIERRACLCDVSTSIWNPSTREKRGSPPTLLESSAGKLQPGVKGTRTRNQIPGGFWSSVFQRASATWGDVRVRGAGVRE